MAHKFRNLIFAPLLWLGAAIAVVAQVPEPQLALDFTVFSSDRIVDLGYLKPARVGSTTVPVQFFPTERSPRYQYRGPVPLEFVNVKTGQVVASVTPPLEMTHPLFIFSSRSGGEKFDIFVVDDSSAGMGPKGVTILNFSNMEHTGKLGKTSISVAKGLNPTIPLDGSSRIQLQTVFKGRPFASLDDNLGVTRGQRALLFLLPPFNKGALDVQYRILIDEPPDAEAKKKAKR